MTGPGASTDPAVPAAGADPSRETRRFLEKQQSILDAASELINTTGSAGMTLAAVADAVGLNTASVTYYYRRRDDLALACYGRALEQIAAMVDEAGRADCPRARVRRYVELHIERLLRVRRGDARPITVLSDIRTMDDPVRTRLSDQYRGIMRRMRAFFGPDGDARHKALLVARVHVLLENCYWLSAWIGRYYDADFPRIVDRMMAVFDHGLAPRGKAADWMPPVGWRTVAVASAPSNARERFLQAATRLINERGYRGASVERIASELNVTKGSFYHHLEAKDDLVLACFERGFDTVSSVQIAADTFGETHWDHLAASIAALLDIQFSQSGPLLRTTALQALPVAFRAGVIDNSNRMARRFAGTMIDAIAEGSMPPADPLIASQMLMATINSAYELAGWAERLDGDDAIRLYGSTIAAGLFDPVDAI